MNKVIYQAMIGGLIATILEKEVVLGKVDAQNDILKIVDLIEDLDMFWNSSAEFDSGIISFQGFIKDIKHEYTHPN